jgi:hypothetical protein
MFVEVLSLFVFQLSSIGGHRFDRDTPIEETV